MSTQAEKSGRRRDVKVPAARSNGVIADAANDDHILQMAITVARCRAAERHAMIADAAYYRAEKRGFEAGHELEDWLAAEQEVAREQRLTIMSPSSLSAENVP